MKNEKFIGIGVDVERIDRFRNVADSFLNKIFTEKELNYCFSKVDAAPHLAARFSGKEAVIKALNSSTEKDVALDYKDIEITNKKNGYPFIIIRNKEIKLNKISISLSHSDNLAIAFVILY